MTTALRLVLVGLLAACSDAGSPVSVVEQSPGDPPATPGGLTATYTLVKVNGEPLPAPSPIGAGEWDYGGAVYKVIGATLTFSMDGTYSNLWQHQQVIDGAATNVVVEQVFVGTYASDGDAVWFLGPGATTTARIVENKLTWEFSENFVLKFKR